MPEKVLFGGVHLFCLLMQMCAPVSLFVCRNGEKVYKLSTGNSSSSFDFDRFNTSQPRYHFLKFLSAQGPNLQAVKSSLPDVQTTN